MYSWRWKNVKLHATPGTTQGIQIFCSTTDSKSLLIFLICIPVHECFVQTKNRHFRQCGYALADFYDPPQGSPLMQVNWIKDWSSLPCFANTRNISQQTFMENKYGSDGTIYILRNRSCEGIPLYFLDFYNEKLIWNGEMFGSRKSVCQTYI